jgi:peptidoglycan/LPS O-acetylase OafA/YrhL
VASRRNDLIDAFRGISILMVVVFHYSIPIGAKPEQIFHLGALGVQVFFVISGLVITMTALKCKDALHFAVCRIGRIYPTFFVVATITYLIFSVHDPIGRNLKPIDYLLSLTFLTERLGHKFVDGAYWSLLVEAQFYAVVALSIALLRKRFWMGVLVILVFGVLVRPYNKAIAVALFSGFSSFFLIGMAAWYSVAEKDKRAGAALGVGAVTAFIFSNDPGLSWPALIPITVLCVLFAARVNASFAGLAWIGRISFPLYLIHGMLGWVVIADLRAFGAPPLLAVAVTAVVAIAVAAAAHRWLEEPSHRLVMAWWNRLNTRLALQKPTIISAEGEIETVLAPI